MVYLLQQIELRQYLYKTMNIILTEAVTLGSLTWSQFVNGRAGLQTQASWFLSPHSPTLPC